MIEVKSLNDLDNGALLELARDKAQFIQDEAEEIHIKAQAVELNRILKVLDNRRTLIEIQGEVR